MAFGVIVSSNWSKRRQNEKLLHLSTFIFWMKEL